MGDKLIQQLKQVIPKEIQLEQFVDLLLSPVLQHDGLKIPPKSVILEIGAESFNIPKCTSVHLVQENDEVVNSLLSSIGELYELGYNPKLEKFYPKVQWPVSIGTPMISPLIKWNHTHNWFVALYKAQERMKTGERIITFSTRETDSAFLIGHVVDGRNLVPATAYLHLVWETFSIISGLLLTDTQVVFENVRFHRATNIPRNSPVALIVMVQKETGKFEVAESGTPVCSGRIFKPDNFDDEVIELPLPIGESGIMYQTKDIYKELKLRGYNYTGLFRGLKECDLSATKGLIEWTGNWVTFMDNMLQIKLLQEDTRNLYVPTGIERLAIDAKAHIRLAKQLGENPLLPVYVYKECDMIKSGAVELRGLFASSIPRRKPLGQPVLESYKFVPYETELTVEESIRVFGQLYLENSHGFKIRAVELIDSATDPESTPLGPIVHQIFSDQPLINPDIVVLSKEAMELTGVTVEDKKLSAENNTCALVAASKLCSRPEILEQAVTALKENGGIISREELDFNPEDAETTLPNLDIISVYKTATEKLVLLKKSVETKEPVVIDLSKCSENYEWLPTLQNAVKNDEKIIVFAQDEPTHGILGLFNCLRREPGGLNVKCFFIADEAPKFDITNDFYAKQLKKGLTINVYKNGKWGSYRHLLINNADVVECEHVFNNVTVRGDMSSLKWIEGPLTSKTIIPPEKTLVNIYCAAINFRDIMTASGRISNDVITRDRIEQYNVQGFEFSGRDTNGKRVMGMVTSGALASMLLADSYIIWEIPDHWSMEEAATIPVTYGTVLYAIHIIANIQEGQSILIHAGTGGVGQAAINCCLFFKCDIFITVGTQEKRDWIRENFPQIQESHIGNSRDTSFEQMVLRETNGRGVDVVLNSLSEEKLQASVRCLAPGGKFLEIGKFDLASNNPLGLKHFTEGRSFHGVMLDAFFTGAPSLKYVVFKLIAEGFTNGCVKPLSRVIFKEDEVEQAFRHMASGKHIGKVIIRLRDEEAEKKCITPPKIYKGVPRFYANPDQTYIIVGGLGGFGLELADWLVIRGAKKLVLSSRSGLKNGYQASRIRIWKGYGVTTQISTDDVTTKGGCVNMINAANNLGPVEAIYNLAVLLKDALLENQTEETYKAALGPKAVATELLDVVSRQLCPQLKHFVVFSSVVCGRGNAGQTTYGLANSIMERICEKRKADGLHALAIQWGAIGEVGLVAEMQELQTEIEIGGTLQQRIISCLEVMDVFLAQNDPIVSSIVVAEKRSGAAGADNIVDAVKNILGLRDLKTISPHSTLSELGMDSMMAVEIKQTLEREYEVFLTAQDIRSMTFARLQEIAQEKASENEGDKIKDEKEIIPTGLHLLLRVISNEDIAHIPMIRLQTLIKEKAVAPKVFMLPGIEGMVSSMEPLAANLACHAFGLQYIYKDDSETTIEELAGSILPLVHENLPKTTQFTLVAYSFGCIVALQLAAMLEEEGRIGRVVLIDGAPGMFKEFLEQHVPELENEAIFETLILCTLMQFYLPVESILMHKTEIQNCKNFDERVNLVLRISASNTSFSEQYQRQVFYTSYNRIKMVFTHKPKYAKIKSTVKLFKPSRPTLDGYDEDFRVQALCENPIDIATFEGHHLTILKNPQVAYGINTIFDSNMQGFNKPILMDRAEFDAMKETIKNI